MRSPYSSMILYLATLKTYPPFVVQFSDSFCIGFCANSSVPPSFVQAYCHHVGHCTVLDQWSRGAQHLCHCVVHSASDRVLCFDRSPFAHWQPRSVRRTTRMFLALTNVWVNHTKFHIELEAVYVQLELQVAGVYPTRTLSPTSSLRVVSSCQ